MEEDSWESLKLGIGLNIDKFNSRVQLAIDSQGRRLVEQLDGQVLAYQEEVDWSSLEGFGSMIECQSQHL